MFDVQKLQNGRKWTKPEPRKFSENEVKDPGAQLYWDISLNRPTDCIKKTIGSRGLGEPAKAGTQASVGA